MCEAGHLAVLQAETEGLVEPAQVDGQEGLPAGLGGEDSTQSTKCLRSAGLKLSWILRGRGQGKVHT